MPVVRIFSIRVTESQVGQSLEHLMAARTLVYANQPGFLQLELLEPTDARDLWLVVTHWEDAASFDAFLAGPHFADHPGTDRVAAYGGPSSESELWSFRVVIDSSG